MEEKPVIAFQNCTKKFGSKIVLENLSFQVGTPAGFISVLGKSGSGKTTLLRLLSGLDKLSAGTIFINGEKMNEGEHIIVPPYRRSIGFIFQDLALFPHFTVFENIAFGLKTKRAKGYKNIVMDVLKQFGIAELKNFYPNQLSGGQQQLVALARCLVLKPGFLLMDEPLANLDVKLKSQIRKLVKKLVAEEEIIVLYVTHDHKEAIELSDRIILLNDGKIEFFGAPDEMSVSDNSFVREFMEA